jgi:hypothetical protein
VGGGEGGGEAGGGGWGEGGGGGGGEGDGEGFGFTSERGEVAVDQVHDGLDDGEALCWLEE